MKIYEAQERSVLLDILLEIWEESVRATHHFLSDEEVVRIREYVPLALNSVQHLIVAKMSLESQLLLWELKISVWRCFFFLQKKGETELADN